MYENKQQYAPLELQSESISTQDTKKIQAVVRAFLYYVEQLTLQISQPSMIMGVPKHIQQRKHKKK